MNKPIFIAEVKTKSPYGFESGYSRNRLFDFAATFGDWISIHTDARFGGGFDDIYFARKETNKPILAKGFHVHPDDIQKCFDLGAAYVLTVQFPNRRTNKVILRYSNKILFEINSTLGIKDEDLLKYVYNGRDLKTGIGKKYIGDYKEYREKCRWLCGASLIQRPEQVNQFYPNCDAFIVGENLPHFCSYLK